VFPAPCGGSTPGGRSAALHGGPATGPTKPFPCCSPCSTIRPPSSNITCQCMPTQMRPSTGRGPAQPRSNDLSDITPRPARDPLPCRPPAKHRTGRRAREHQAPSAFRARRKPKSAVTSCPPPAPAAGPRWAERMLAPTRSPRNRDKNGGRWLTGTPLWCWGSPGAPGVPAAAAPPPSRAPANRLLNGRLDQV